MLQILSYVGLAYLFFRLWPRPGVHHMLYPSSRTPSDPGERPDVSIIVWAGDRAERLPTLLASLRRTRSSKLEVILVGEGGRVEDVAHAYKTRYVRVGDTPPEGWSRPAWSLQRGAEEASGDYLVWCRDEHVFERDSFERAVFYLSAMEADLLTAQPFHEIHRFSLRLLGPTHLLLYGVLAPLSRSRVGRFYTAEKFLMLSRSTWRDLGGFASVKGGDAPAYSLLEHARAEGLRSVVFPEPPLYRSHDHDSLGRALGDWRRALTVAFPDTYLLGFFELFLALAALSGGGEFGATPGSFSVMLAAVVWVGWRQKIFGNFHPLGVLIYPLPLALFVGTLVLAWADSLGRKSLGAFRRPVRALAWRISRSGGRRGKVS